MRVHVETNVRTIVFPKNVAPGAWAQAREKCVTTFHMPLHIATGQTSILSVEDITKFPFENFSIVEPFIIPANFGGFKEDVHGIEEIICWKGRGTSEHEYYGLLSKIRYTNGQFANRVIYIPVSEGQEVSTKQTDYELYFRFYNMLYSRKYRFQEQTVSRQVRRAGNFLPNYREYITVSRDDVRYVTSIPASKMLKRMRELHIVRGHLRTNHYTGEKNIWVSQHTRGQGELTQAKEYRFK